MAFPYSCDSRLNLPIQQRLLNFANRARHVNVARAGFHAVEDGAAAPHALNGIQDFHAFFATLIARIEHEAMSVHDGGGSDVIAVAPERRATRCAGAAEDTFGGVVELL